jgi:hypothetical protein
MSQFKPIVKGGCTITIANLIANGPNEGDDDGNHNMD